MALLGYTRLNPLYKMKPSKSTPVTNIPSIPATQGIQRFVRRAYARHSPTSYINSLGLSSTDSTPRTSFDEKAENIRGAHVAYEAVKFQSSGPFVALSCEQGGAHVAVAGKDVLKVLSVDESRVSEVYNLRIGNSQNLNQGTHDVKWGNDYSASKIATSVNSGAIHIWDIHRSGNRYERIINGHERAVVHRISFHPKGGQYILSACHNGTMKVFDLRESTKAIYTFEGKADSVRDVQYNPVKENEFVAAFENGSIQKWDIRSPKVYEKKLNAHDGQALTVDWYADGVIAASGGRDKSIKVWDLSSDLRKPLYTINTINSVARVSWRPGKPNEIASSAMLDDNTVRVWDVRRPWIATLSMEEHERGPIALAWVNTDVLYTVAKDKYFIRHDTRRAQKPIQRLNKSAIGWNVYGDVAFATELRNGRVTEFVDESTYPGLIDFKTRRSGRRTVDKHHSEEQPLYKPPKASSIAHTPLFDFEWFAHAAQHYTISSENVWDACKHNARIAKSKQRYRTFQTWKILQLLFSQGFEAERASMLKVGNETGDNGMENEEISLMEARIMPLKGITEENEELSESGMEEWMDARPRRSAGSLETNGYSPEEYEDFDEESDDDLDDFTQSQPLIAGKPTTPLLPSVNYSKYSITPGSEGFGMRLEALQERKEAWHPTDIVGRVLEYYTNQGDVQMCVTLSLVLEKFVKIDETQAGEWFTEYINLLQRFRLWTIATAITNASKQISQVDTTVYVNCNHCHKPLVNNVYWACERCRRLTNSCSICHQTVKGIYAWCQGCSHGGHLNHMRDWFKQMQKQSSVPVCPTGCGHSCELTLGNVEESA